MSDLKRDQDPLIVTEEEKKILLNHNYDGIQELNHPLPSWWNFIFYAAIIYSCGYFIYYEFMRGPTLRDEFNGEYSKVLAIQEEFRKLHSAFRPETYAKFNNPSGIKKGEEVFELNCLPCHEKNGKGDIGPNLTDKYWLVAKSTPETIYQIVFNGSEENGMPPWSEVLTSEEIYQAVSFVSSLKNTHQKGGKAPQGILIND